MINDLLDRIEDLVQDNTLLLVALNEKDEELQLAKEDEAALAQSGVELTAHNTQLQGQVHTLESENHQLKIDHKGMTELYNDAHANGDALFAKSQSLERELDSANAQANALHVKNTSMQLQLDALRRAYGANSVDAVVKAVKA